MTVPFCDSTRKVCTMIWMQISLSSDLTQVSCQSQLCNSTAQAMSCCPPHSGDTRLGPEASSTTFSSHRSGRLVQRGLSATTMGTPIPFHQSVLLHRCACKSDCNPAPFSQLPPCRAQSATFLLGQAPWNLLRLRFLWTCFLGHLAKTSCITIPREERSGLSSRVEKRGCTAREDLAPRSEGIS